MQFENQVALVVSERSKRLEGVSEAARTLAESPLVRRSLEGELGEADKKAFSLEAISKRPVSRKPQKRPRGRIVPVNLRGSGRRRPGNSSVCYLCCARSIWKDA